ncbi:MAG: DUF4331 family protein [Cyanobacteriota bacterium]|nr:DUF4331 family protein [Cyanobacteriota bacterium]
MLKPQSLKVMRGKQPIGSQWRMLRSYGQQCLAVVLLVGVLFITGCGDSGSSSIPPVSPPQVYAQLERLAVPALNELFMDFSAHDASNRSAPTGDTAFQSSFIRNFINAIGRPQSIADAVILVVIPDVIEADLSLQDGIYFGTELASLGAAPANFGGRRPADDPIDVTLSVVFGDAVTGVTEGAIPELTTDNVGPEAIGATNTFPYLGSPI